uniref:Heterogeneous nuclear ribonucleoprotein Q acidic domain-containing protein n=1 Tax=Periophthalmus magnuspinnatus TaxID=409849 RepID=A0A3B3ZA93_9GOBI
MLQDMAELNGSSVLLKEEEEPMETSAPHTENYQTLIDAGLPQKVAESLDNIFQTGLVAYEDLDERAIDALREFNEEGALTVLQQFRESDLSHVQVTLQLFFHICIIFTLLNSCL